MRCETRNQNGDVVQIMTARLVVPARLRTRLRLEDTMVAVWAAIDRVEIMRDDEAEALDREFNSTRESDYALLESANLI